MNTDNTIWKITTSGLAGLCVSLLLSWFTAFFHGVSHIEMESYVQHYAPWVSDRPLYDERNGHQNERLTRIEARLKEEDNNAKH